MVGYLMVLCVWMWESPRSVREFLNEGSNLQVLIQPITQTSGVDSVVQGLSAFLLGIVYEYNREAGSVTRATLHPILQTRVGPDVFANRILRLREDVRFKNVGPDVLEMSDEDDAAGTGAEDGVWFDWPFVEFLKNNYLSVQRSILLDPGASDTSRSKGGDSTESLELIATLRTTINEQKKELDEAKGRLLEMSTDQEEERSTLTAEVARLVSELKTMQDETMRLQEAVEAAKNEAAASKAEIERAREEAKKAKEEASKAREEAENAKSSEKEQEDLLVLLEELSTKRKADKVKMKEAGIDVSEDEEEDDDDDEGDDGGE